ncbi:MAG: cytochrome c biogenesis protein ResB [Planctomycetes bacterium]|nr:cytochrome c biogenesis protein ResB [Planctomycetota bacterium]
MLKTLRSFEMATIAFGLLFVLFIVATFVPYASALVQIYGTDWFHLIMFAFIGITMICCLRKSYLKGPKLGVFLTHISIILIAAGAIVTGFAGTYGQRGDMVILEKEGADSFEISYKNKVFKPTAEKYEVEYRQNGQLVEKKEERIKPEVDHQGNIQPQILPTAIEKFDLGFKVFLKKFRVERYGAPETLFLYTGNSIKRYAIEFDKEYEIEGSDVKFKLTGFYPDFMMGDDNEFDMSYSEGQTQFKNPALRVELNGPKGEERRYLFANYQERDLENGMHSHGSKEKLYSEFGFKYVLGDEGSAISQYVSEVEIQDGGQTIQAHVGVNEPLVYKGFRFYQNAYSWVGPTRWQTVLMVKKDHGYQLIYLSFALFLIGNLLIFVYNPFKKSKPQKETANAHE